MQASPSKLVLRASFAAAFVGLVAGGAHAAWIFFRRPFVLEFQAGTESSFAEKMEAVLQSMAIESVGWGLFGLAAALVGLALAPLFRANDHSQARRFTAGFGLAFAALFCWLSITWMADDALPFLTTAKVLLLDAVGLSACLFALLVFAGLVRFVPFAPKELVSTTLTGILGAAATLACAQEIFFSVSGGYRSPARLAAVAGIAFAGILLAAALARPLAPRVESLAARWARGPMLPGLLRYGLLGLLVACVGRAVPSFQLSALPQDVEYATVTRDGAEVDGPNVVFVTVDTLRADGLSCYGYPRPTSPFLDSLAESGTRFADPVAAAAWTKPATGTIFTGLYPSRHGALYHGSSLQLPEGERTMAEAFRQAGYVTAGFVSNPNVKAVFDFDRGFDVFFDSPVEDTLTLACIRDTWFGRSLMELLRHQFNWKYENDVRQMNRHVEGWLAKNGDERFFLYVHYIDPHIPYDPPSPWREEFAQDHGFVTFEKRKELVGRDLYDAEVRYTDVGLEELVATLKDAGVWDNTMFVLTSDHGEEFFEHEVLGHGFSLFQPVVQVPLIFHGAGIPPGRVVEEPVQILDVPATVAELAGIARAEEGPVSFGDGESFAAAFENEDWKPERLYYLENEFGQGHSDHRAFVFSGVRQGRWKLVLTEQNAFFPVENPENDSEALYDLLNDPGETVNLIADPAYRDVIEELLAKLQEHGEFLFDTGFRDIEPATLTPEIQANLEALGY